MEPRSWARVLPTLRPSSSFVNVAHARDLARRSVPRTVFDYVDGGADDERTLADNSQAFADVTFRPCMGRDIGRPELRTTVLGTPVSTPILFAPCGLMGTVHPAAEPAVARVAERAGTIAAFSTYTSTTLEHIAASAGGHKWFQLYFLGGRAGAESLIGRARAAGYEALVVTVDTNVNGHRERDIRNGVRFPLKVDVQSARTFGPQVALRPGWLYRFARAGFPLEIANAAPVPGQSVEPVEPVDTASSIFEAPPTWADLEWIRELWGGPVVVKGLMTGDDARRAVDAGADAVIVSNHGGRQLDGVPGTLRLLPEVVEAIGDEVEVLVDGGVRRGSDVVKAVSLGARAVLIGRPYIYGLGAGGEAGVARILEVLTEELTRTLQLLGCPSVADLGPEWVSIDGSAREVHHA